MTYIVEIEDNDGARESKEYEVSSAYVLVNVVQQELKTCPDFKVVKAWHKERPERVIHLSWCQSIKDEIVERHPTRGSNRP